MAGTPGTKPYRSNASVCVAECWHVDAKINLVARLDSSEIVRIHVGIWDLRSVDTPAKPTSCTSSIHD